MNTAAAKVRLSIRDAYHGRRGVYDLKLVARALGGVERVSSALTEAFLAVRNRRHPSDTSPEDPTHSMGDSIALCQFANSHIS